MMKNMQQHSQAEQGAEGAKLEPAHDELLENGIIWIATTVAALQWEFRARDQTGGQDRLTMSVVHSTTELI